MTQSLGVVAFFLIVWGLGTYTQYRYWSRVRKLIHEIARDHAGYLGTGMCRIKFSRKAFILILADEEGVVTGGYEIKTLSLRPYFVEIPGLSGASVTDAYDHMPSQRYHDAFEQALSAIERSQHV
ncbi:transcriptional regulator GutM [Olsenella uli]|uniref:transcriptional regulator GutM n=1 Tax=Olsenella uli TaxID=133926 RepID=UPI0028E85DC9|nr:transcriptional regulator GutM [Olsenella uli]